MIERTHLSVFDDNCSFVEFASTKIRAPRRRKRTTAVNFSVDTSARGENYRRSLTECLYRLATVCLSMSMHASSVSRKLPSVPSRIYRWHFANYGPPERAKFFLMIALAVYPDTNPEQPVMFARL